MSGRHSTQSAEHDTHCPFTGEYPSAHLSVLLDMTWSAAGSFLTHRPAAPNTKPSAHFTHDSLVHRSHVSWQATHDVNSGLFPTPHSMHRDPSSMQSVGGMHVPSTRTALWQRSDVGPRRSTAARQRGCVRPSEAGEVESMLSTVTVFSETERKTPRARTMLLMADEPCWSAIPSDRSETARTLFVPLTVTTTSPAFKTTPGTDLVRANDRSSVVSVVE